MATPVQDKYYLKTLHDEIDLFDRKLAHLLKYDTFATEAERVASAGKMNAKRELLARTARQMANDGIEFKPTDLPRSFRTESVKADGGEEPGLEADDAPVLKAAAPTKRQFPSPFAGTALDGQASIQEYKRSRLKPSPVSH